ncbi:MAG: ROK family transcriptional regulator [Oscillospiraceae bacterium]|jgi:predicted NBD/HSP70 family sugar kinase|nr:ROK family transcriptional regulator [Oscillospiraceae bacterium]
MKPGISKEALKANNNYAILNLLYTGGAMPRKDIAEAIGLTPATVTLLTNEMINRGLLSEGGEITNESRAGRRKVLVDIDYDAAFVLGVYIEHRRVIAALSYMNGRLIDKLEFPLMPGSAPIGLVAQIKRFVGQSIDGRQLDPRKLRYVGVSVIGYVDTQNAVSENTFGLFESNLTLGALFEEAFGVPVTVDNNVRSLAIAEIDYNRAIGKVSGLFVKHSPGLGGAIITDNALYNGLHYHSGELGHFTVNIGGAPCVCGKRGCVETVVGREALIRKAAEIVNPDTTPVLWRLCLGSPGRIKLNMMAESARSGDLPIAHIMRDAAGVIALAVENSMQLLDGNTVILFGDLFKDAWFFMRFSEKLREIGGGTLRYALRNSIIGNDDLWKAPVAIAARQLLRQLKQA